MAAPVIEAGDCTVSGSNTAAATWAVSHPNASTGDLLIWNIAWDDSTDTTDVAEPAGVNSEVLSELNATPVASNGTEVRGKAWYTICTGAWTAGTRTFTPTATESWTATCIRVPAGEFDPADPFGTVLTRSSTSGTDTTVENPTGAIGATDGTGTLVWFAFVDADPLSGTNPSGWTIRQSQDLGAVAHGIATRDTQTTNGETVAETTWGIAGDSWGGISYVVRGPPVFPFVGTVRFVGQTPTIATTDLGENAWAPGAWASGAWATGAWDVEASTDHTVTPSVGAYRLVGQTPTVGYTHSVTPAVGAYRYVGQTPSVSYTDNMAAAPSVGTLLFVGQQPSVGATFSVAPSAGAYLFVGQQPTVSYTDHVAVAPSVGTLRFDGAVPSVGFTHSVTPTAGTFQFTGLQPTVTWGDNIAVAPSAGELVFVGQTPTVENLSGYAWHPNAWASGAWAVGAWAPDEAGTSVSPSVGTLRFVGLTPTVETGEKSVSPQTGVLRFVGNAPPLGDTSALVDFDTPAKNLLIGADQQEFRVLVRKTTGTDPTVDIDLYENGSWVADLVTGTTVTSTTGQIVSATWNASLLADISGADVQCFVYGHSSEDAQVEIGAVEWIAELEAVQTPTVGVLRFVGQTPTVSAAQSIAPSVGTVLLVGQQPTISYTDHVTVTPSVGTLVFAGQQPTATVAQDGTSAPLVGTLRFEGQQPLVGYTHSVDPLVAVLRLEGAYPSVTVTEHQWASPSTGTVRLDGQQPTAAITANLWAAPSAGTLRFDGQQPSLVEGGDKTTAPSSGVLRFVGNAPTSTLPTDRVGGDDLPPGWNRRRSKLKLKRELEYTEQIREIYRALTGSSQAAEAEAILAPVVPPVAAVGESEDARVAAIEARAEALRVRADRLDAEAVQAEIALRLLYQQWRRQMEDDDWAAIQALLPEVL